MTNRVSMSVLVILRQSRSTLTLRAFMSTDPRVAEMPTRTERYDRSARKFGYIAKDIPFPVEGDNDCFSWKVSCVLLVSHNADGELYGTFPRASAIHVLDVST